MTTDKALEAQQNKFNAFLECVNLYEMAGVLSTLNFSDKHPDEAYECLMAIRAALSSPPVGRWLPIETAPKDGTLVDLWYMGERYPDCYFQDDGWQCKYSESNVSWTLCHLSEEEQPTHWMPVPKGPKNED